MKAHRTSRSFPLSNVSLIMLLLTTLGLAFAFMPAAIAQHASTQPLADQYLGAMLGATDSGDTFAMVTSDAVLHTPEGEFRGPEGTRHFASTLGASFSDLTFATQWSVVEENLVVVRYTLIGVHTGEYQGRAPLCSRISVPGMALLRVDGSGIGDQWISYDQEKLLTQIDRFAQIDPGDRPACGDRSAAPARSLFEGPPTCDIRQPCPTAF